MSEEKRITLLQSLLKCFSDSESLIRYVVETQDKGKKVYTILSSKKVEDRWKILYCKNIVALSIAPGSQTGQLSKDALSAFRGKVVNSKNKAIVDRLNPRLMGPKCSNFIAEEVEHLERTIELGVRAANSPYDKYTLKIQEDSLKPLEDVQIFFDEAVELLEQLFFASPYEIISRENEWFARAFPKLNEEKSQHYTKEQVLSLMACALILSLNVTDVQQINSNIESFIRSVFPDKGEGEADPQNAENNKTDPLNQNECVNNKTEHVRIELNFAGAKCPAYLRRCEQAQRAMRALTEAFEALRTADSLDDIQRSRFSIVHSINKCAAYAELVLSLYPDDDMETDSEDTPCNDELGKLKEKLLLLIERYYKLVEKELAEVGELNPDLADIKLEFLSYLQEWHLTVVFLEESIKRDQESIRIAESQLEKEYIQRHNRLKNKEWQLDWYRERDKEEDMKIDDNVESYRTRVINDMSSV